MSRLKPARILSGTALCAAAALALAVPFGAFAQDSERGGFWMQLRLAERLQWRDNDSNDPADDGETTQLITDVDFALSSETRTEAVTLDFGSGYRFVDGVNTDGFEGEFVDPTLELSYRQTAAAASFRITARASQVDLDNVSALSLSTSEDAALAPDFDEVLDGGTRRQMGLNTRLSLRDDAPFGLIFALTADDISYSDLPPGSTTNDRSYARVTTTGRFDITPVLQARVGLHYEIVDRDGAARSDRYGLSTRAILTRPDGEITAGATVSDGDGGTQTNLRFGRSYSLPQTTAAFSLGATQSTSDTLFVTGTARFEHSFGDDSALGPLTLTADRSITLDGPADEEVVTALSLAGSYALSPLATLNMNAELGQAEDVRSGDTVTLSEIGVSLGYRMDRNWRADAAVRASQRTDSPGGITDRTSTTLSLGVTRSFDLRR